jgi:hypothetical protein
MLKTCGKDGCMPLEQIRGELRPGDYHDVIANNRSGFPGAVPEPEKYGIPVEGEDCGDNNPAHCVEINDGNRNDFRICCGACGKATPWAAKDLPGMPDAGADWTRKKWNEAAEA